MMLIKLDINNFKGIADYTLDLDGADINLFGANATGKTSVADAYRWLLTGKNSSGAKEFDIYPKDAADGVQPCVSATFMKSDGTNVTLRRSYKRNFVRKKGETTSELKGNTTELYIDDVPTKSGEFTKYLEEFGGEALIVHLTDPLSFAGKTDWKERRDILQKTFINYMSDRDVIDRHDELKPLANHIGIMDDVEKFRKKKDDERKKLNNDLQDLPGRIDEAERLKPDIDGADEIPHIGVVMQEKLELEKRISDIRNGVVISDTRAQIAEAETDMHQANSTYLSGANAANENTERQCQELRSKINICKSAISNSEQTVADLRREITHLDQLMEDRRREYRELQAKVFDKDSGVCPTCGQSFPAEQLENIRADFNTSRAAELKKINEAGSRLKAEKQRKEDLLEEHSGILATEKKRLPVMEDNLSQLQKDISTPLPFNETPQYSEIFKRLESLKAKLVAYESSADKEISKINVELQQKNEQLDRLKNLQSQQEQIDKINKRIEELLESEKTIGLKLADCEKWLALCDQFTRFQADDFEEAINSNFSIVKWKLFDRQINGGISQCCEAMVDGVEFNSNLNTAARINAGLDIINALGHEAKERWPIWIDNAESITEYIDTDAQLIKLFVSSSDKALRMMEENNV